METNNHIRVNVQATTNFSEDEEKELRKSIAKILNKRKKPVAEIVPMDKRVYIMNIHVDSIMTSRNADIAGVFYIAGDINSLIRQLESKYGKKFYCEEIKGEFDKKRLINKKL